MLDLNEVKKYIASFLKPKRYCKITTIIENGKITYLKKELTIKEETIEEEIIKESTWNGNREARERKLSGSRK